MNELEKEKSLKAYVWNIYKRKWYGIYLY